MKVMNRKLRWDFFLKKRKFLLYNLIKRGHFILAKIGSFQKLENKVCYTKSFTNIVSNKLVANRAIRIYSLQNVRINSRSSSILRNREVFFEPLSKNDRFSEGYIIDHDYNTAILNISKVAKTEDGFFLAGNGSYNWFHWLIEILPKILLINEVKCNTILVDISVKKYPTMLEALRLMVGNRYKIVYLENDTVYSVDNLYYVNEINKLQFNVFDPTDNSQLEVFYNKDFLKEYVHIIKNKVTKVIELPVSPEKIYIKRKGTHRIPKNDSELELFLQNHGFVAVVLEELTFPQQISLFSSAREIVGLTGAGWSNMIFCHPRTKMLIISPDNYVEFKGFQYLAQTFELSLNYLYYENHNLPHNSNSFSINLAELDKSLK